MANHINVPIVDGVTSSAAHWRNTRSDATTTCSIWACITTFTQVDYYISFFFHLLPVSAVLAVHANNYAADCSLIFKPVMMELKM